MIAQFPPTVFVLDMASPGYPPMIAPQGRPLVCLPGMIYLPPGANDGVSAADSSFVGPGTSGFLPAVVQWYR
jgi:hypothetical protein